MSRVRSVVMYRPIAENALKGNEIPINHHKIFLNKAKDHFKKGLRIPIWPLSLESKYFMLPLSASKIEIGLDFLPKSLKTLPSLKSLERLKLEKLEMAKAWVLTKKISLGAWSLTRLVETLVTRCSEYSRIPRALGMLAYHHCFLPAASRRQWNLSRGRSVINDHRNIGSGPIRWN